ncbi:tripartite motif-containing protein 2-like, partial [Coregonus clupeaformis]|uniref:tripartite motif-containing protein 2-like n=1 Tax=Coregonus clupeaformis TaxID=59861 RepID=UPI001E1C2B11
MEAGQPSPDSSSEECTVLEALPGKGLACPIHTGKVTELYCSGCTVCVCEECVSGQHADHPTTPLLEALETHRDGLQEGLAAAQNRLPQISEALVSLREILKQLTNQRALIEEDIHVSFEELHKTLDVRKSVLLMELEVTYGLKQKVLQAQLDTPAPGPRGYRDTCTQTEEALSGEASAASRRLERSLGR